MSHILRYIFVIAVAYDGRRLGAGKMTLKASLSSSFGVNRIGRRTVLCMLLIVALALIWNLLGR